MNWIRVNYDRVAVVAAALFLLICAFFIWRAAADFSESFTSSIAAGPPKPAAPTEKALELQAAAQKLPKPPQWTFGGRSGLFVPEKHFIGPAGLPVTLQTTEVHPPVPNEWLDQFGLPISDADVLAQDPDGDGFTNLEEWQGHTDPTDKNSRPPFILKLKMKSFNEESFPLVFTARPSNDEFQLNYLDPKTPTDQDGRAAVLHEPTFRVKLGEVLKYWDSNERKFVESGWRAVDFKEKSETKRDRTSGTELDVSELTLENTRTNQRMTLVKDKAATSRESVAHFVYSWPANQTPREYVFKKEQEFSLPPQIEIKYKLIDVQPDKAVIINTQNPEERIEVGPLNP